MVYLQHSHLCAQIALGVLGAALDCTMGKSDLVIEASGPSVTSGLIYNGTLRSFNGHAVAPPGSPCPGGGPLPRPEAPVSPPPLQSTTSFTLVGKFLKLPTRSMTLRSESETSQRTISHDWTNKRWVGGTVHHKLHQNLGSRGDSGC